MNKVCDKHKKTPVFIYHNCIGCEIESLRPQPVAVLPAVVPGVAAHLVEWTWKDTLEYVRKDFLSCEVYQKLRDGGSVEFNKRQLTNLLNGAFEHYAATRALTAPHNTPLPAAGATTTACTDDSTHCSSLDDPRNTAILAWWAGKRPFGWSEQEHLEDPTAYCTGAEKPLALLAVELAKAQLVQEPC